MDLSFGRTRRALLRFATPARLVARAALLWRHDHSHGTLLVETLDEGPRVIVGKLRDHPYVASRVARNAVAESFRHVIALTGARDVKEAHALDGTTSMTMRFSWD